MAFPVATRPVGTVITEAIYNQDLVANINTLRGGGIAAPDQAEDSVILAANTTQFKTLAKGANSSILTISPAGVVEWNISPSFAGTVTANNFVGSINGASVNTGNLPYPQLPAGSGTWDISGGSLTVNGNMFVFASATIGGSLAVPTVVTPLVGTTTATPFALQYDGVSRLVINSTGVVVPNVSASFGQTVRFTNHTGLISVPSGNLGTYSPTGFDDATVLRFNVFSGNAIIEGFPAGETGRMLIIIKSGTSTLQFTGGVGNLRGNVTLPSGDAGCIFVHDGSFWSIVATFP
jgi:hypothetical protein